MTKTLKTALVISLAFATIFTSCRKNGKEEIIIQAPNNLEKRLNIEEAKSYHKSLVSKFGDYDQITISGKADKSYKKVDFSQSYIGESKTSYFIEVPISYTKRAISLSNNKINISKSSLEKMFSKSFDRLVIYKDKISGMLSEKVFTVIPSVEYISKGSKDLLDNHFENLVDGFSGYVTYKSWNGQFLSSQSYTLGKIDNKTASTKTVKNATSTGFGISSIDCNNQTIYRGYIVCEDFDDQGLPINCQYFIEYYDAMVCDMVPPIFHNHTAPLPGPQDPYWEGFPQGHDPDNDCLPIPRPLESPLYYCGISLSGLSFSMHLYNACFCQGYSWVIFEEVISGTEYSFPIVNQNFVDAPRCYSLWESNLQIPTYVPEGTYFIKVNIDGDVFYHQIEERDGTIKKRYKHYLDRS